ncbi:hypothetical protein F4778DRAFT_345778 [Xylariomycetidae sp. FL2044]|nr:hypothetical protein F4778DRAFT_345778 [Xylariomycetidae sp. FL2044]
MYGFDEREDPERSGNNNNNNNRNNGGGGGGGGSADNGDSSDADDEKHDEGDDDSSDDEDSSDDSSDDDPPPEVPDGGIPAITITPPDADMRYLNMADFHAMRAIWARGPPWRLSLAGRRSDQTRRIWCLRLGDDERAQRTSRTPRNLMAIFVRYGGHGGGRSGGSDGDGDGGAGPSSSSAAEASSSSAVATVTGQQQQQQEEEEPMIDPNLLHPEYYDYIWQDVD